MASVQIFTVIGKNGLQNSFLLRETMEKLASGKHELSFNCFMSSRETPPIGWEGLACIFKQSHTSLNHSTGLNLVHNFATKDYVLITDVDVAVLQKDWDQILIDKLKKNDADIVGVDYWEPDRGYLKFPIVTFFLTKANVLRELNPDFRPTYVSYPNKKGIGCKELVISNEEESEITNRPIGFTIKQDTGWRLPFLYKKAGYKGITLTRAHFSPRYMAGAPQLWLHNQEPFVSHLGKSTKRNKLRIETWCRETEEYVRKKYKISIKVPKELEIRKQSKHATKV